MRSLIVMLGRTPGRSRVLRGMQNIQAFLKFAGSLSPEQFTEFSTLIGFEKLIPATSPTTEPDDNACAECGGALFEVGDVVHLASGGPGMTVAVLGEGERAGQAHVVWLDADEHVCDRWLPLAVLEHAE